MQLTFIGLIQLVIGAIIFFGGSLRHAIFFMVISGLFSGGAAILLPSMGGSSIPPIQFACLIVYLRILVPRGGFLGLLPEAIRANRWLVLYTLYGVASAVIAPRLFANQIDVAPLRFDDARDLFDTVPLGPSTQNITTSVYMIGTMAIAVASYLVCRIQGGVATLISAAIAVGWLHIVLGIATALAVGTPLNDFFELFRNGNYAQLNQSIGQFVRIRGLFPESSSYADFAFAYFALNAELWYRSIRPKATGRVALGLAAILFFSTSSTAYLALLGYLVFFILRIAVLPHLAEFQRVRQLVVVTFAGLAISAFAFLVVPELLSNISDMVFHMTLDKSDSTSAQQRLFWAAQGFDAFKNSFGLGIGPGSFRSSSLLTALVGSTGIVGIATFIAYAFSVFQPTRRSSFSISDDLGLTIGGAFGTAALLALIPSCLISPSADLGANFALFAGAALALRPIAYKSGETAGAGMLMPDRGSLSGGFPNGRTRLSSPDPAQVSNG